MPIQMCEFLLAGWRRPLKENRSARAEIPYRLFFTKYRDSDRNENERKEKDRNKKECVDEADVSRYRAGQKNDQAQK